ncbi:MAG: lysophospholipid acyltransferase family protein [Pseudomonadota bacterium]
MKDLAITLLLWGYFTVGFLFCFAPFYLLSFFFASDRPAAFQRLNSLFYRGFFFLCRMTIPGHKWEIAPEVRAIRGAVIVSNHVSYLDSILMVSLFPRLTTIAKARLFEIPIFGRVLALSGYIPSSGEGAYASLLIDSLDSLATHFANGGNIVVFPEGTRSRDGVVGPFNKGAFKIARKFDVPLTVLRIRNTDILFTPGKFLFNTGCPNSIRVDLVSHLHPDYGHPDFSMKKLMGEVHRLIAESGDENH